jgi:RNA polymerase sigma factor (sigma-70 family)
MVNYFSFGYTLNRSDITLIYKQSKGNVSSVAAKPDASVLTGSQNDAGAAWSAYVPGLHRYLMRRLWKFGEPNAEDVAKDLAQEVHLGLLQVRDPGAIRDFQAYLYGVAANIASRFESDKRREQREYKSLAEVAILEHDAQRRLDEPDHRVGLQQKLVQLLESLSPVQRTIVTRHLCDGQNFAAIGKQLSLSKHTVKKYFTQALVQIRTAKKE